MMRNQEPDIENNLQETTTTTETEIAPNSFMYNLLRRIIGLSPPSPKIAATEQANILFPYIVFAEMFYVKEEDEYCFYCFEKREVEEICRLNCQHDFCVYCTFEHVQRNDSCPTCKAKITTIQTQTIETKLLFCASDA